MNGNEHRAVAVAVADSAFGHALVNLGGDAAGQEFALGYGDIMALSGDFFTPEDLFRLAGIPGRGSAHFVIGVEVP